MAQECLVLDAAILEIDGQADFVGPHDELGDAMAVDYDGND